MKQAKSEIVMIRLRASDLEAIRKSAKRQDMAVSEYMRACTLTCMAMDFDAHAYECIYEGLKQALGEMFLLPKVRHVKA